MRDIIDVIGPFLFDFTEATSKDGSALSGTCADPAEGFGPSTTDGTGKAGVGACAAATPMAAKPYAHPHYWAAFVLIGDPQ